MTVEKGLEFRDNSQREKDISVQLPKLIKHAQSLSGNSRLGEFDASKFHSENDLANLPVLRKSELIQKQADDGLLSLVSGTPDFIFQSPGPIYEPGFDRADWWGFSRFLHALGVGKGDRLQNCFAYNFTPAGQMFENGARAVGAQVFPAGTGQSEQQARAAADLKTTSYAGTPDFLKSILEAGDAHGLDLSSITKAAVGGGPLFPQLREYYTERGIICRQCYATADLGNIAYESEAMDGLIVDDRMIVEIVTPGTGNPVQPGEIGEVVVTSLNFEYPLIRFATGDLSAEMPGQSPCGRTNKRIVGWRGRADQATKVKGMFVRPEQVAELVAALPSVYKARVEVSHDGSSDQMQVRFETEGEDSEVLATAVKTHLKLRGSIQIEPKGSLPNDGLVIQDLRDHNT